MIKSNNVIRLFVISLVSTSLLLIAKAKSEQWPSFASIIQEKIIEAAKNQQIPNPSDQQAKLRLFIESKQKTSIDNTNYLTMTYEATEYQIKRFVIKDNIIEGILKRDDYGFSKRQGKRSLWRKISFSKLQIPIQSNNVLGTPIETNISGFQEPVAKITVDVGVFKLLKLYKNGAIDRLSQYQEVSDCSTVTKLNEELDLEISCAEAMKFRAFDERVIEVWKALDQNL